MENLCKGCNKSILEGGGKQVGEWLFCEECFQNLMNKPSEGEPSKAITEEPSEETPKEAGDEAEMAQEPPAKLRCNTCRKILDKEDFKSLGPWKFCRQCYYKLVPKTAKETEPEEEEPQEKKPIEIEHRPGTLGKLQCQGCHRKLLEGGHYTLSGHTFCPNCYYTVLSLLEEKKREGPKFSVDVHSEKMQAQVTPAFQLDPDNIEVIIKAPSAGSSDSKESSKRAVTPSEKPGAPVTPPSSPTINECQACSRKLPYDALELREGFTLCQACLASDADSALTIARVRHRKYLKQLKDQLGGEN